MGWLPDLFGRQARAELVDLRAEVDRLKAAQNNAPAFLRTGIAPFPNLPPLSMVDAQAELYQRLVWVYVAVTITARTAAGSAFEVKKLKGEKTEQIENHPFEELLRRPNPLQSRMEFLEAVFGFWLLTGNCYIWQNKANENAEPSELWIVPPMHIEPVPDRQSYLKGYVYRPDGAREIPIETWEICHLKRFHPRDQFVGLSPIEALAVEAEGDLAAAQWNKNYFAKDNAKPEGALAFKQRISDPDWERMKRDIKEQHGGTERRLMMLRGAGEGGAQWLQFGISQKDMEFLAGRTFTKEMIYDTIAPGLASMLSVNSTEANSVTGKATFDEMSIWPLHVAVAEKITRNILPAYGDDLVGEFEDVRATDRAQELAEQQAAFNVLTVKEIRQRYYDLPPLGDERDDMLVASGRGAAQPADSTVDTGTDPTKAQQPEIFGYHIEAGVVTRNEVRERLDLPPIEDDGARRLQDALQRLSVVQAAVSSGIGLKAALELAGLDIDLPPVPEQPQEDTPSDGEAVKADVARWKRKAAKRIKAGQDAAVDFTPPHAIPASLHGAIAHALDGVTDGDGLDALFDQVRDFLDGEAVTPIPYAAIKAIQATRLDFEGDFEDLLSAARAADVDRREWAARTRTLLRKYGGRAFRDGLTDGGVPTDEADPLDPDDQGEVNRLLAEQSQYVTALGAAVFDRAKAVSDGQADLKPAMWFNKSIAPFYDAGRLSADKNGMYEWVLGTTEEHCSTCLAASGQRHRLRDWHRRGVIPRADVLECQGFQCDCDLVKTTERARGQMAAIPLGG